MMAWPARRHCEPAVGLEIVVNPNGHSRKILQLFIESLENREKEPPPGRPENIPSGARPMRKPIPPRHVLLDCL
ncbi:MAG: hypothetical protein O7B79_05085 [SAR324 cluster bacterium]|nr:hypothetical protein [SAR324 cluster bacterium]